VHRGLPVGAAEFPRSRGRHPADRRARSPHGRARAAGAGRGPRRRLVPLRPAARAGTAPGHRSRSAGRAAATRARGRSRGACVDPLMFGRAPRAERARLDSSWAAFQMDQVTEIVRGVRDVLNEVRPGLPLSAAVVADTLTALTVKRQPWSRWVREGLLDRAY